MEKTISAADANRKFSQLLRDVREGKSYVVTSHGRPVARLTPVATNHEPVSAMHALLRRLRSEPVTNVGRWKRDELYD
jgi:prevent-host-death family protein